MQLKKQASLKRFLIFLAVILLAGAAYLTYDNFVKDSDLSSWSFVPNNTLLVYESDNFIQSLESIHSSEVYTNLSFIKEFRNLERKIDILDSIAENGNFRKFFAKAPMLASMHVTSSKDFDMLFVVEIRNLSQQAFLSRVQSHFSKGSFSKKSREYEGFTITEISDNNGSTFTYIFYKNFFIGSFSAFLVEDAIRTVANVSLEAFRNRHPELYSLAKLKQDQGNLYLNNAKLSSLFNTLTKEPRNISFAQSGYLDLKVSDKSVDLTGFTFVNDQEDYLNLFSSPAGNFDVAELIPTNAALVYHISSKNTFNLGEKLSNYFEKTNQEIVDLKAQIQKDTDFDIEYLYNLIDEEICLINLESNKAEQDKILILKINDMGEATRFFNGIGERYMLQTGDSLFQEQYGDYEIRKLPVSEFPKALIGPLAEGFPDAYYLQFRNNLIFSSSLQQLKALTISIQNESTWTKSLRINKFLGMTNKASGFSLFINTQRIWNQFLDALKPDWKSFFTENQFSFRNMEFIAAQFSAVDEKYYTNITVYQPKLPKRSIPERVSTLNSQTLAEPLISKPWIVTNHNDRTREVLVQDTAYNLYLLDQDFSVLWDKNIGAKITDQVKQLDYYKNGKLQYIFSTEKQVHIIDRNGNYLPEFPKSLKSGGSIMDMNIIDYSNTRDYRLAVADGQGNAWFNDKNLKPLDGWNPKKHDKKLVMAPVHCRINGKDVIVALQEDGVLHATNRRGQNQKGFPISLKADVNEAPFIITRNTLDQSTITVITISGELIELNFNGNLIRREQLYKPGAYTRFSLLKDVSESGYLILRNTETNYELLDQEGRALFSKSFLSSSPIYTQYYQLGGGTEFIVFVDSGGSYLYLYDRSGNLITGRPLVADKPIALLKGENDFQLYVIAERKVELISFSL
ncbi:MAG: DUF3352 domain-containing protein [Cyclobacteriaceae bacterium]